MDSSTNLRSNNVNSKGLIDPADIFNSIRCGYIKSQYHEFKLPQ